MVKKLKYERMLSMYQYWSKSLENVLTTYRKPFLINAKFAKYKKLSELYIYPAFMSAGKQQFVIESTTKGEYIQPPKIELYRTVTDYRDEEIPVYVKTSQVNEITRTFSKD